MKNLISSLALAAAIAAPAAAFADTAPAAPTAQPNLTTTAAQTQPASTSTEPAPVATSRVAMQSKKTSDVAGYMHEANDDRQGFARVQAVTRQLGATN